MVVNVLSGIQSTQFGIHDVLIYISIYKQLVNVYRFALIFFAQPAQNSTQA